MAARSVSPGAILPASDVFLSHASEDKDDIARPLRTALEGVVILSRHFFAKQWTQAELDGLFGKKMDSGQNVILPVWHHISKDEVIQHSPLLAGIAALNTATMTVDEIAGSLAEAVRA